MGARKSDPLPNNDVVDFVSMSSGGVASIICTKPFVDRRGTCSMNAVVHVGLVVCCSSLAVPTAVELLMSTPGLYTFAWGYALATHDRSTAGGGVPGRGAGQQEVGPPPLLLVPSSP